jgi:hypothetical protein
MELRVQKEVTPFLRISAASGSERGLKPKSTVKKCREAILTVARTLAQIHG